MGRTAGKKIDAEVAKAAQTLMRRKELYSELSLIPLYQELQAVCVKSLKALDKIVHGPKSSNGDRMKAIAMQWELFGRVEAAVGEDLKAHDGEAPAMLPAPAPEDDDPGDRPIDLDSLPVDLRNEIVRRTSVVE